MEKLKVQVFLPPYLLYSLDELLDSRNFPLRIDSLVRIASTSEDHRRMTGEQFLRHYGLNDSKKVRKSLIHILNEKVTNKNVDGKTIRQSFSTSSRNFNTTYRTYC